MKIQMNDSHINTISQLRTFLKGSQGFDLSLRNSTIEEKYRFIDTQVDKFEYQLLKRKDKRTLVKYLKKITGYKHAQLHRLIKRASGGQLQKKKYVRKNPNEKYSPVDIKLLEKTDKVHKRLNTYATKKVLERENKLFNNNDFENIAKVSPAHIHNLRSHPVYKNIWINSTKANQNNIGETRKPKDLHIPGYIRIDTVHQHNLYHVNAVDSFLQWEVIVTIPRLTQKWIKFALMEIIAQCPFIILGAHTDRGGEYINETVKILFEELDIDFTKSRARHSNDNGLPETKNGSIIRKNFGYAQANRQAAIKQNTFNRKFFNPYLNYHRPCAYPTEIINSNGKIKKVYKPKDYEVPYEKLKQVSKEKVMNFLKAGITFEKLDIIAYEMSDNEWAKIMRKEQEVLYKFLYGKDEI